MIQVFTDGSCKGNPGPGGWAAILIKNGKEKIIKGNCADTTNNRMEMIGVIEALRFIHENHLQQDEIKLFTDSNLIVQTINQGWKRKANQDLWEEMDELIEELSIQFEWVKGHHKNKYNNECDRIAFSEAQKAARAKRKSPRTKAGGLFNIFE